MSTLYEALKARNLKRWDNARVTKYYPSIVKKILANKARYQAVAAKTGVPWFAIAVIHVRESDMNFNTQLAQGDPLGRVSTHVPRGQGPYLGKDAWERAAVRALLDTGGHTWGDWSPGGMTTFLEKYNGLGYSRMGRASPYVWAGTNQYVSGKYVSDGQYSSGAVDTQPGCVSLIKQLNVDVPTKETPTPKEPPKEDKPRSMATSKTGNAAIVVATAGAGEVISQVKDVADAAHTARDAATDLGLMELLAKVTADPRFLVAFVVVIAAVFIWFDRRKRMQQDNANV